MALAKPDDFEDGTLDAVWTFVDPVGDCSYGETGGKGIITVASGAGHDAANNAAARIVQPIDDTDFDLRINITPVVSGTNFRDTGFTFYTAGTNRLRCSVYGRSGGGSQLGYAASYTNNTTLGTQFYNAAIPASQSWLRVARAGNDFEFFRGTDGVNWTSMATFTYAMTVNAVALHGGNASGNPAHTAEFLAFQNPDYTPPGGGPTSRAAGAGCGGSRGNIAAGC